MAEWSAHTLKAIMEILKSVSAAIVVFYFYFAVAMGVVSVLLIATPSVSWPYNWGEAIRQSFAYTWKTYFASEHRRLFWQALMLVGSLAFVRMVYDVMGPAKAGAYVVCETVYYAICYYMYTQYRDVV